MQLTKEHLKQLILEEIGFAIAEQEQDQTSLSDMETIESTADEIKKMIEKLSPEKEIQIMAARALFQKVSEELK